MDSSSKQRRSINNLCLGPTWAYAGKQPYAKVGRQTMRVTRVVVLPVSGVAYSSA
jgi:hypothetical protein